MSSIVVNNGASNNVAGSISDLRMPALTLADDPTGVWTQPKFDKDSKIDIAKLNANLTISKADKGAFKVEIVVKDKVVDTLLLQPMAPGETRGIITTKDGARTGFWEMTDGKDGKTLKLHFELFKPTGGLLEVYEETLTFQRKK